MNPANASEIVHFPPIRHQQYMVIHSNNNQTNYISSLSFIFSLSLTLSLSHCLSVCLFHFLFLSSLYFFLFISTSIPFRSNFFFLFCLLSICLYTIYKNSILHLLLRFIWSIHIAWEATAFSKKKIIHFNNSIWSFGTRPTEQKKHELRILLRSLKQNKKWSIGIRVAV